MSDEKSVDPLDKIPIPRSSQPDPLAIPGAAPSAKPADQKPAEEDASKSAPKSGEKEGEDTLRFVEASRILPGLPEIPAGKAPETETKPVPIITPEDNTKYLADKKAEDKKADTIDFPASSQPTSGPLRSSQSLDMQGAYRRWLESKNKEELIDLIITIESQNPTLEVTRKMIQAQASGQLTSPSTYHVPDNLTYTRLPVIRKRPEDDLHPRWRIALINIDQSYMPIGIELDEEITIGRSTGDVVPDIDLTPYGASTKGISRIHASIRPTESSLVVLDNNSTNGTFCNRVRITNPKGQQVQDGVVLTFGKANFLLKVISAPVDTRDDKKRTLI